jgi:hypothetical protein
MLADTLSTELQQCRHHSPTAFVPFIVHLFRRFMPLFDYFTKYVSRYDEGVKLLAELRASDRRFDQFLVLNEVCEHCKLETILHLPVRSSDACPAMIHLSA